MLIKGQRTAHKRAMLLLLLGLGIATQSTSVCAIQIEHLAYSGHGEPHIEYLKERAQAFRAKTGIEVEINVAASDPAQQILIRAIAGTPPDAMDVYPSAAGGLMANGVFEDLTPWFMKDPTYRISDLVSPSLDLWRGAKGEIFAIPPDVVGVAVAYAAPRFHEAGLQTPRTMGREWTWETVLKITPMLVSDTDGDGRYDRFGVCSQFTDLLGAVLPIQQAGTHFFDKPVNPTKAHFNTPEMLESLKYMREVWRLQGNSDGPAIWNGKTALDLYFQAGFIGYMVKPGVDIEWEMVHQPIGPADSSTWIGNMGYEIGAGSNHKEAAWQWVTLVALDRESMNKRVRATGRIPSYLPYLRGFNYARIFGQNVPSSINVFVEQLQDTAGFRVLPYPVSPAFHPIRRAWNPVAQRFLRGELAAEALVEEMQKIAEVNIQDLVIAP